jgi:hypothetical protein
MRNSLRSAGRWRTSTTLGITSPLRSISTVSPMARSSRAISSSLCNVALDTVTPLTTTGRSRATGVSTPVRPTWTEIASSLVSARSAANL